MTTSISQSQAITSGGAGVNILSCDGGGIRGLITALLIADLETDLEFLSRTKGYAGTSTGGLIALGLASKLPIENIVEIYKTKGSVIFQKNGVFSEAEANAPVDEPELMQEGLFSGPGYRRCQYVNDGLKEVAEEMLGDRAMKDSPHFVLVNSARLWDDATQSWEASTLSSAETNPYNGVLMKEAALATSAAPTYFPPFEIAPYGYFADGGVFANNPAVTAISEAREAGLVTDLSQVRVLSLGTGAAQQGIPSDMIDDPSKWGAIRWFNPFSSPPRPSLPLFQLTMAATAEVADVNAAKILGDQYQRANVILPEAFELDDWENWPKLEEWTTAYMKTDTWKAVKTWVSENWT